MDLVHAPGERPQHRFGLGGVGRLQQQPALSHDDGIGGEDDPVIRDLTHHVISLRPRHTQRVHTRLLVRQGRFIHIGRHDVEVEPRRGEQFRPAERGRGKHKRHGRLMIAAPESR